MATFTVTNANDTGAGSLRDAVAQANTLTGLDTILFDAAVFDGAVEDVIHLAGEIAIAEQLVIDGGGLVTISGDANRDDVRVGGTFVTDVDASLSAVGDADRLDDNTNLFVATHRDGVVTFQGLTLTGGNDRDTPLGDNAFRVARGGTAIVANGDIAIIDSTVSGNSVATDFDVFGGAVAAGTDVTVTRSTLSGNRAAGDVRGGAVLSFGSATVIDSVITDNRTDGDGGGLYLNTDGATGFAISITGSTIAGNVAGGEGGGVVAYGPTTIANSTISGNRAAEAGGVSLFRSDATISNTTITDNVATTANRGGGLLVVDDAGRIVTLTSSIVAGNGSADLALDGGGAAAEAFASGGGNVIGTGDVIAGVFDQGADVVIGAADPRLGPLQDNGGPTPTMLPQFDSPALDAGANPLGLATDQRGAGFARVVNGAADAGAAELQEAPGLIVTTAEDVVAEDGLTSLREAVAFANATAGADTVSFADALGAAVVRLTLGQIEIRDALTIDGGGDVTVTGDAANDDVTAGGVTDVAASLAAGALGDNTRLFDIVGAGAVTLDGLILTGGSAPAGGDVDITDNDGGAVRSVGTDLTIADSRIVGNVVGLTSLFSNGGGVAVFEGSLTLRNSVVSDNRGVQFEGAGTPTGGGIYANGADVTIARAVVSGNAAIGYGGGLYVTGGTRFLMTETTVSGNASQSSGGGGVNLRRIGDAGVAGSGALIENSTISGNSSSSGGGGLRSNMASVSSTGAFTPATVLVNTTVADNTTGYQGGGVFNFNGLLELRSSTVTGNRAPDSTPDAFRADGVASADDNATRTIVVSSIIVGNDDIDVGIGSSFDATPNSFVSLGGNVVRAGNATGAFTAAGDLTGAAAGDVFADVNPATGGGLLADNGGPVATVALRLADDNPALGLALAGGPAADARGETRDAAPDAGAFEAENPAPTAVADAATVFEDAAVVIDVLANDTDVNGGLDPTSVRIEGAPGDGRTLAVAGEGVWTVDPLTGAITFTPEPDYDGAVTDIAYTVADTLGARSAAATVAVAITPVGDASITFQYLVAREITGIRAENGNPSYRTAEFSGARNDVAFEDLVFDPTPDEARIGDVLVGGTNNVQFREFFAVLNEGGDTAALDAGDRLYRVSNTGNGDRLTTIPQTNQSLDVVNIRAAGLANNKVLGELNKGIRFGENGFGLDNGPEGEGDARWLNRGDTLVFLLTGADGASDDLERVSFTVRTDRALADVGFDADGDGLLLRDTNGQSSGGFVEDGGDVFLRGLTDGTQVEINFRDREVRVNGETSTADFAGLFDDPGRIGLGASLTGGRWALDDLTLGLA